MDAHDDSVARMGKFFLDRSIREYSEKIWNAKSIQQVKKVE